MFINDTLIEFDELVETVESLEDDETVELEVIRAIVVHILEIIDDETVETDECDETDDELDVIVADEVELDEMVENELFVDELDDTVCIQLEDDETDETQSTICIDWYFTLVNTSTIVFKQNDEIDELDDELVDTNQVQARDLLETVETVLMVERFLSLMWNLLTFEI